MQLKFDDHDASIEIVWYATLGKYEVRILVGEKTFNIVDAETFTVWYDEDKYVIEF